MKTYYTLGRVQCGSCLLSVEVCMLLNLLIMSAMMLFSNHTCVSKGIGVLRNTLNAL